MPRTLSIVRPGDAPDEDVVCTMREAAHAEVDRHLATNPDVMMIGSQHAGDPMLLSSLPDSRLLLEGMVGGASETLGLLALSTSKDD